MGVAGASRWRGCGGRRTAGRRRSRSAGGGRASAPARRRQKRRASRRAGKQNAKLHRNRTRRAGAPPWTRTPRLQLTMPKVTKTAQRRLYLRRRRDGRPRARRPRSAGDHDMQPPRPVRAEQQRLLDVGRARRAGDEIDACAARRPCRRPRAAWRRRSRNRRRCPPRDSTTMWLSGRKLSVVGLSGAGDERERARLGDRRRRRSLTALRSCPSEAPCRISSAVAPQGIAARRGVGAHAQASPGRLLSRRKRATSAGNVGRASATSATLAWTRSASALNVATRASSVALPALRHDAGGRLARAAPRPRTRRGASAPVTPSERRMLAKIAVARAHCVAPLLARHWLWKVAPCGAARSR